MNITVFLGVFLGGVSFQLLLHVLYVIILTSYLNLDLDCSRQISLHIFPFFVSYILRKHKPKRHVQLMQGVRNRSHCIVQILESSFDDSFAKLLAFCHERHEEPPPGLLFQLSCRSSHLLCTCWLLFQSSKMKTSSLESFSWRIKKKKKKIWKLICAWSFSDLTLSSSLATCSQLSRNPTCFCALCCYKEWLLHST